MHFLYKEDKKDGWRRCIHGEKKQALALLHRRHGNSSLCVSRIRITPQLSYGSCLGVEFDTLLAVAVNLKNKLKNF